MVLIVIIVAAVVAGIVIKSKCEELEAEMLGELGFSDWNVVPYIDDFIAVKSHQYDEVKYFKDDKEKLTRAEWAMVRKRDVLKKLGEFLDKGEYSSRFLYSYVVDKAISLNYSRLCA